MPQIDLKYSVDLTINSRALFEELETAINQFDSSAGACKCRAYPSSEFLHSHCLVHIKILRKAHRTADFIQTLLDKLNSIIRSVLPNGCYCSVELSFCSDYYITSRVNEKL